jgi:hypothetical protein
MYGTSQEVHTFQENKSNESIKMKKYERPLHPLASWTDTSGSDDDDSGHASFIYADHVDYSYQSDDDDEVEDERKKNPKLDLSSMRRGDRWLEECHPKESLTPTNTLSCWGRTVRSRICYILCALTILLLGLIWASIHSCRVRKSNLISPGVEPTIFPPPPVGGNEQYDETVVLQPNQYLVSGQFRSSPNGKYRLELTEDGDLVLTHHGSTGSTPIWSTKTASNDARVYLQPDGNVLLRHAQGETLWSSKTHGYPGARLVLTDHGQLSIQTEGSSTSTVSTVIWMDGIPRSSYNGPAPANEDLVFPVRGAFYYP